MFLHHGRDQRIVQLKRKHGLVLGAVELEQPFDVSHKRNRDKVAEQDADAMVRLLMGYAGGEA